MLRTYTLPVCSLIIDNAEIIIILHFMGIVKVTLINAEITIILHFVGIVKVTLINFIKL